MTVRLRVRNVVLGAVFGLLVLLIWWVNRSDVIAFDPTAGLVLIGLMFVAAGFSGGLTAGFVAGCVSALTVPGDYLLFGNFPFYNLRSFVMTMATAAVVVMLLAAIGALLPRLGTHRKRLGRSIQAFVSAWRTIPS
jgi:hypothetical protein